MEIHFPDRANFLETIRGSFLLTVGSLGVVLIGLGWILQTGRVAGYLAVYGILIAGLGFGTWALIALSRVGSQA